MAFDPIYIFWVQSSKSGYNILLKKSADGGQTFGSQITVFKGKNSTFSGPRFWQGKTRSIYVIWTDGVPQFNPAYNILFKKGTGGGSIFGPTINVNSNDPQLPFLTNSSEVGIAVDSKQNIYVVSSVSPSHVPDNSKIVLHKSTHGGQTFAPLTTVSNQGTHNSIAIDSKDNIYVSWRQNSQVLLKKSTDGGQTFGPATEISNIGSDIQINIDSQNNVYISWRTQSQNDEVFVKKSTDGGKTFSKEVNISNSPQDSYNYDITIESKGKLYAVWYEEGVAPAGEILLKKSTDGGNTFGNPIQIAQLVKLSDSHVPKIGISSNVLYVVWNDATLNNPNSNVLFIKRSTDGGKIFGSSIQIN